ncbi:MAG TPA: outer membrane lipoprotein-sorting protein [Candidatus Bipolaricaulota bacterium]
MKWLARVACAATAMACLILPIAAQEIPSAQDILQQVTDLLFPPLSVSVAQMESVRPDEEPIVLLFQLWRKGSEKALLEVLSDGVQKGQKILRNGDLTLIFFPNICKTLPLDSKQSLFGSSFNVGDLARLDFASDYEPTLLGTQEVEGAAAYELELKAKVSGTTYDRILFRVRVEDLMPLSADFYTLSGKLLNQMVFSNVQELAGQLRPATRVMTSTAEPDAKTTLQIQSMEIPQELPDEMFGEDALQQGCSSTGG